MIWAAEWQIGIEGSQAEIIGIRVKSAVIKERGDQHIEFQSRRSTRRVCFSIACQVQK